MTPAVPQAPTPVSRLLVRYVLGFSVGVVVGLAPFLGKVKVPLFSDLLELYPLEMQDSLIRLSSFLIPLVAVAVQFSSTLLPSPDRLTRYFFKLLASLLVAFVVVVGLYTAFVVSVSVGTRPVAVVIGWSRSPGCGCPPTQSDLRCIAGLSVNPAELDTCWNHRAVVKVALTLSYLYLMAGFVALVGLVLLKQLGDRDGGPERAAERAAPPGKRRPPRRARAAPGSRAARR